jgi:predicted metal-dependent peptidase
MTAAKKVSQARTRLLLDSPWFGSLSMRLHVEETDQFKTMATNGTRLLFNPHFVESVTEAELTGVIAHEVMHCALLHPYRIGTRNLKTWNMACDYAINTLLFAQGFSLPKGVLHDAQYDGMSAEQIYAQLDREQQQQQQQSQPNQGGDQDEQGGDQGDDEQPGQIVAPEADQNEADGSSSDQMSAVDWQIATEQATAIAKKAGRLPGDADRAVKANRASETNWREILRRFVEQTMPCDYSWTQPNRRYIAAGLYLPGTVRENMPRLAVAIDTSGSIGVEELNLFARELTQILHEARPEAIDVIYCDSAVRRVETFSPDDSEITLGAHGGGGTLFQPVFDHVAAQGDAPAALIYFTDLEGPAPQQPEYPVLWVTTQASALNGPFGETVRVSA